jgi:hypothetical protein
MSTHASAFSKVFGDPATDISRRLAAANRAADEAEILTLEARQQQLAAEAETQAARAAAASACRRLELAEEDVRQANRVASDARHERRLALAELRDVNTRLAQYEPIPLGTLPAGQLCFLPVDSEGEACPEGYTLVGFTTKGGDNPKTMAVPLALAELLQTLQDAIREPDPRIRQPAEENATTDFQKAAVAFGISKTRTSRLLIGARASTGALLVR